MEMKFAKFRRDERCKKLERSLKLALLRKSGKATNEGQGSPFFIPSSISSINTDTQDLNYTASFMQTFQIENEVVSSSNNLRSIMAKKRNMYSSDNQLVTSSSIKQSLMEKNTLDRETMALRSWDTGMPHGQFKANMKLPRRDLLKNGDYSSPMAKKSCSLQTNDKDVSDGVINSKVKNTKNSRNDNMDNGSLSQLGVSIINNGYERTFFNWRVMLNDQGNLLVKGKLESGKVAHSKPITKRLTATTVQSVFKQTYHLDGSIVDNRSELPEYIRGKFHNGFPDDWENVHQIWLSYVSSGSKPSFHWPTKITDSDDDIKSEVTDCTFLCAKQEQKKQCSKSDVISKKQIPNDLKVHLSPSDVCSNDWKIHTSEAQIDNASKSETRRLAPKHSLISSAKMEMHDLKIWNKENQYKCENENMYKMFFRKENTMRDLIQQDKIDIIIKNLLHKDCPKEYILKILQMFDFLDDVFSFRVDTDESNDKGGVKEEFPAVVSKNTSKESKLYGEQMRDNKTEINSRSSVLEHQSTSPMKQYIENNENNRDVHKISSRMLEKQSEGLRNTSEKVNDMRVSRLETKNTDDSDNETYTGVPRIISDYILKSTDRYSFKRCKYKKKRKTTDVNPITRSDNKSNKKFKEDRTQMHHTSSSDDYIENPIEDRRKSRRGNKTKSPVSAPPCRETPGNIDYDSSVSITEDEELQVKETLEHPEVCKRKETDNLVYKHNLDISSTDDEIELSNSKYENTKNVVTHAIKGPRIVNNYDGTDFIDDGSTMDHIKSYLDVTKCNAFKNHCSVNTNKHVTDVEAKFLISTSNVKKRNKDTSKSKFNDINNGHINQIENTSRVFQIPRGYEYQVEPGKSHEKDKSRDCKKVMEVRNGDNKSLGRMKESTMSELMTTDKCKLLSNWIPRIIYSAKPNLELGLVFEGKLLNEAGHVAHRKFVTERIHKRLSPTIVETRNCELYQLVGDLHDPKHVLPKEIVRQCRKGCPSDINQFCKLWKSLQEGDANKGTSKEEDTAPELLNVPTSSRGRKRFPPLHYWDGERVTMKDDKVVYTPGNCKNYSAGSLTSNTKDRSILQEGNKLEDLKTVETVRTNAGNEGTPNVLKHIRTSVEKERIEEGKTHEKLIDGTEKDDDAVYQVLKRRMGKYVEKHIQYDIKTRKSHKISRDNDARAQLEEHKNKYNTRQESPVKMQNLKYLCYRNIPPTDDILSDDQISQF